MGYPDRLLGADEELVYDLRPHWRSLVRPALLLLVTAAALGFVLSRITGSGRWPGLLRWLAVAVAVVVVAWWVLWPFLEWLATHYVLTSNRIIIRTGVLRRQGRDMPLARVNDVSFRASLFDRMFGCGTLMVESGSEQGQLVIANVPGVEQVQREIYRLHEADDLRRRGLGWPGPAPQPGGGPGD